MARDRERQRAYNAQYYAANREQIRVYQAAYRSANQGKITASRKGLSLDQLATLLAEQGGLCAICDSELTSPQIDHDHACCPGSNACGSCVRGLLCMACNHMLGKAKDSAAVLESGAAYLRHHESKGA